MTVVPQTRRALVIEDDVDIRSLLVQILGREGFEVVEAATASEGREKARAGADLITLDLNLPDGDGMEVCRDVRQFSDAYILMVTARADEIERLTGIGTGADDYISKPFSPRELVRRIHALFLSGRREVGADAVRPATN